MTVSNEVVYLIYDSHLKLPLKSTYKNKRTAQNKADKLDLIYGGYRYFIKQSTK